MSNFDEDPELEEKLTADPRDLDEDMLQDVQVYKSRKLKALRDEGQSGGKPEWWAGDHAPQTMDELAGAVGEDGEAPSGGAVAETEEEPEEAEEPEEEAAAEEEKEESEAEEPEEERDIESQTEPAEKTTVETTDKGVPQVGWSSGVPATDEVDFDNDVLEGIYQRQDQLMETLQAVNQGMSEVDVGGEAIESIQDSLDELNEKVDTLVGDGEGNLLQKVEEVHEFLTVARDMETKLAELPPLPDEEELVEAGIIDDTVEHDGSDTCFRTSVDGRKAALHYGLSGDRFTVYHFSLPAVLSESVRHALEDVLARALFEHAREEGKTVHPQAPRLRSGFLARHPEYYELTPDSVQERHG
jgi:hypothetical protein